MGLGEGQNEEQLEQLLEYVHMSRGFDFSGYKRTTLRRRMAKRMNLLQIDTFALYLDRLQVDPAEFSELFDFILINITHFYRDPEIWERLQEDVVPAIVESVRRGDAIRVWCAGCASGQEAYTLAMIFGDVMGATDPSSVLKIYATDVDHDALSVARQGLYSEKDLESVPLGPRRRYFEEVATGTFAFDKVLRRCVIFGRHDLMQDAPISRVNLLTCRNTLMYFNSEAQNKVMSRFHFGLAEHGYLMLGKAEMMFGYNRLFVPVDLKNRIFSKRLSLDGKSRLPVPSLPDVELGAQLNDNQRAREIALEAASVAQIIVDRNGQLALANSRSRDLFGLSRSDVGRPFQDLEISYNPAELRSLINRAQVDHRKLTLTGVPFRTGNGFVFLDIDAVPLYENETDLVGVGILFFDVSREKALRDELEQSNQELETAMEELQSSNEELETTNEELQSTNEELETTNEELQSTNEELETMNEELQSTNEELSATNEEQRSLSTELNQLNLFLKTMMESINAGFVVLDIGLRVKIWNRKSFEMWGLRDKEVMDQVFLSLDLGLPLEKIGPAITACLSGDSAVQVMNLPSVNRRGKQFVCKATISRMMRSDKVEGVILMLEELQDGTAEPAS